MTPDPASIIYDLDLLDDWLAGKGYGEEAGLVMRAMTLINDQARELRELRASKHDLEDARELRALRVENETLRDGVRTAIQERDVLSGENWEFRAENEKLRAVLKEVSVCLDGNRTGEDILSAVRAAAAALKETE